MTNHPNAQKVLDFWFSPETQPFWFAKSDEFDQKLHDNFFDVLQSVALGECANWRETIEGRLAEIIVLDQFSRNLYRNTAKAFAQDGMAVALAQEAIKQPDYTTLDSSKQKFILMPFMHSESRLIHEQALPLFEALNDEVTLDFELRHKEIVDRFGRYPHRNRILERDSGIEELVFLQQPNSSF